MDILTYSLSDISQDFDIYEEYGVVIQENHFLEHQ